MDKCRYQQRSRWVSKCCGKNRSRRGSDVEGKSTVKRRRKWKGKGSSEGMVIARGTGIHFLHKPEESRSTQSLLSSVSLHFSFHSLVGN
jgi:hypothetical protein